MATIYITEFAKLPTVPGQGKPPVPVLSSIVARQAKTISGSSARSDAFNAETRYIRVAPDAICSINYDDTDTPAAATTDARMPADSVEYFAVNPGKKLAFITNT